VAEISTPGVTGDRGRFAGRGAAAFFTAVRVLDFAAVPVAAGALPGADLVAARPVPGVAAGDPGAGSAIPRVAGEPSGPVDPVVSTGSVGDAWAVERRWRGVFGGTGVAFTWQS
jgi:hypothetical protein